MFSGDGHVTTLPSLPKPRSRREFAPAIQGLALALMCMIALLLATALFLGLSMISYAEEAHDEQIFADQATQVQAMFHAEFGDSAALRWTKEHNIEISPIRASDGQRLADQPTEVRAAFLYFFSSPVATWRTIHERELTELSPWRMGWRTPDNDPLMQGTFSYSRYSRTDGSRKDFFAFLADAHSPLQVSLYDFANNLLRAESLNRGTRRSCETRVELNLDYHYLFFRQGGCKHQHSEYPYLRAGASGFDVPVREPDIRVGNGHRRLLHAQDEAAIYDRVVYVDAKNSDLVVEIWSSYRPVGLPITHVRIPKGFALEFKEECSRCPVGYIFVTYWNDKQGWHYTGAPASEAPFTSLDGVQRLTVFEDGTARYEELPYKSGKCEFLERARGVRCGQFPGSN